MNHKLHIKGMKPCHGWSIDMASFHYKLVAIVNKAVRSNP